MGYLKLHLEGNILRRRRPKAKLLFSFSLIKPLIPNFLWMSGSPEI